MKNTTSCLFIFFILTYLTSYSQSIASYDISLTTIWNAPDHTSVPSGAHWSPLVGATHNTANLFMEPGEVSPITDGIKSMAETGATSNFSTEVSTAIGAGFANQYIDGIGGIASAIGTFTKNDVQISEDFPYITLVSMVAPSPDWFIALNSEYLRSGNSSINNGWKETYTIDIFAYDAGTDSGTDYTSANLVTTPREPVAIISGFPIQGNRMGTITFTFKSVTLSSKPIDNLKKIKIYPNPTKASISISNPQNNHLKSIEIYTVLGHLVKHIPLEKTVNTMELNLSFLKTGVYLIKLNMSQKISKIEKLIVE